jgi:hypothetical protein
VHKDESTEQEPITVRDRVTELAAVQIDNYRGQPKELISHFNRETSALDAYRGRQLLELLQNADDAGVDSTGCQLLMHVSRDCLIVANTGKPFSKKGLTSLVISDCRRYYQKLWMTVEVKRPS